MKINPSTLLVSSFFTTPATIGSSTRGIVLQETDAPSEDGGISTRPGRWARAWALADTGLAVGSLFTAKDATWQVDSVKQLDTAPVVIECSVFTDQRRSR
jgi:hypothetical protein